MAIPTCGSYATPSGHPRSKSTDEHTCHKHCTDIHPKSPTWIVNTPRGSLIGNTIIHATNGYSSALVPELRGKIVPVKGIVARLVPTNGPQLTESYMMRFSDYEYDYMIPRPDGSIVVGGGRRDYYYALDKWFNVSDDGSLIEGAEDYFNGYMQRHFHGWEDCDVRTEDLWTGSEYHILCSINISHLC
jgi:glycine/D-amino acid oxidase-like deaminating enzyme